MNLPDMVDRLAFVLTQVQSQIERIRNDDNFYKLSDDAKLALGGIESNMDIHLSRVLNLLKNPKGQCCERDYNYDGNCDIHSAPGVLKQRGNYE